MGNDDPYDTILTEQEFCTILTDLRHKLYAQEVIITMKGLASEEEDWPECLDDKEVFNIYYEMLNYLSRLGIHYRIDKNYD